MVKSFARNTLHSLLSTLWLREGTVRRGIIGPYRSLNFGLSAPLMTRLSIFYGVYEQNVHHWLTNTVKPGMTVYVIGAHIGVHVLYIAQLLKGKGAIYAFEGWPENYDGLTWNIRLNSRLGVPMTALPLCVARESGSIRMAKGSSDGKHHIAGSADEEQITVKATSLDDFWAEHPTCPDLILMDIEGFELDALRGGEKMIAACKPRLALEHHDQQAVLRDWLDSHQYVIQTIDSRHIAITG